MVPRCINYYYFIILSVCLSVTAYRNQNLDACVSKTLNQIINENSTLTFVYDKYIEAEVPEIISNPYTTARCKNPIYLKLKINNAYIIHFEKQEYIKSTLQFLNDTSFWIPKQSPNNRFLIIIKEENVENLLQTFTFFWSINIHNVVVLTSHSNKNQTSFALHTSNPFHQENDCGQNANVINSQNCEGNISIKFYHNYKNLNGCNITFMTHQPSYRTATLTFVLNLFTELAATVNGNFVDKYLLNDTTVFAFMKKPIIAVTLESEKSSHLNVYDYSHTALSFKLVIVVKGGGTVSPVKNLLVIFQKEVWMMIIVCFVVTSIALWLTLSLNSKKFKISRLEKTFLDVFSATIWGYFLSVPKRLEARCIIICYLIYQLHIQTGFTSNLVTVLTTPQYEPGITNLEELVQSKLPIIAYHKIKDYYFWDIEEPNSIYSKIKNQMQYHYYGFYYIVQVLNSGKGASLMMNIEADYLSTILGGKPHVNIIQTDLVTGNARSFYIMAPGHFFKETLNSFIRTMDESGITQKNVKKMYDSVTVKPKFKRLVRLNLKHLFCAFVFIVFGLTVACIVFVIELIVYYFCKK